MCGGACVQRDAKRTKAYGFVVGVWCGVVCVIWWRVWRVARAGVVPSQPHLCPTQGRTSKETKESEGTARMTPKPSWSQISHYHVGDHVILDQRRRGRCHICVRMSTARHSLASSNKMRSRREMRRMNATGTSHHVEQLRQIHPLALNAMERTTAPFNLALPVLLLDVRRRFGSDHDLYR